MRSLLLVTSLLALPFAIACASGTGTVGSQEKGPGDPAPATVQEGTVVSPITGLHVDIALASTHLGAEKCTHDESADLTAKSCAIAVNDAGVTVPPRGTGACGGACDFSSITFALTPAAGGQTGHVKITTVSLLDATSGAEVQQLTAYTPLVWKGTQFVTWDETITSSAALKTSYTLAPPAWSTIDPTNSYAHQYKVRLVLEVDGAAITLESDALSREAPVST